MKILDVGPFEEGLQKNITMLSRLEGEMKAIETAVGGLVALDDSLKGQGGNAIRAFYNDCHMPFLQFFMIFKTSYDSVLSQMKSALDTLEPASNGFIQESFLEADVKDGLTTIDQLTLTLTDEANGIMDEVSDIIALPHLDDSEVHEGVKNAQTKREKTVTDLHEFDATQTAALTLIEAAIVNMEMWLADIEGLMAEGLTAINFPREAWNAAQENAPIAKLHHQQQQDALSQNPRVKENGVDVANPSYSEDNLWTDIAGTVGLNINDWQEKPINAAASLAMFGNSGYQAAKDVNLAAKGFGITRSTRVYPRGDIRTIVKITKPELIGVRRDIYRHRDAENYAKVFRRVDPMTNVKESFKFAGNKIGYLGIATTVGGDIYHGVNNGESTSEIAGNVTGDVAVAGASIAASAWAGAKIGALVGVSGGPLGVAVGAVVGLAFGIIATAVLSEVKFMDVDNDGELDSIGDAIKKGTTGIINKVSSWFK